MKKFLLLFILFLAASFVFPQQKYYTFLELKGMEDQQGNTHLFYRMYNYQKGSGPISDSYDNSIYHLDLENKKDTLFLYSGKNHSDFSYVILDVEFWNHDPSTYIYGGASGYTDGDSFILRYDENNPSYQEFGQFINIEISHQSDSLVIASAPSLIKSMDGGKTWNSFIDTLDMHILSINPFDDKIMFLSNYENIFKTTDGGKTINTVDTMNFSNKLFYDKDSIHIYGFSNTKLYVSNNNGEQFTWQVKYSSENPIFLSVDYSQAGNIYLADGRFIYFSNDYGNSFSTFKELDRKIVGIYKKPNSNKLYAVTKYDLYEITPDSIKTLKHLQIDPDVFSWYPLEVGNKWVYHEVITKDDYFTTYTEKNWSKEVIGKTIKENGKEYFVYKFTNYSPYYYAENFERLDSSNGKIFRYTGDTLSYPSGEYEVIDLLLEMGDTVNSYFSNGKAVFRNEGNLNIWDTSHQYRSFRDLESLALYNYNFVSNVGIDSIGYGFDFGSSISYLKGALINGIVYGDTNTVVGINEEKQLPQEFSLSQNYPNPFNPTTKIKYTIAPPNLPKGEALRNSMGLLHVTLKVYDILGNEVATLVSKQQPPGNYEVEFDAANPANGTGLASGVYFYKLTAGSFHQTKKMILLR